MALPTVVVYSRPGCRLCEVLIEDLVPLLRDRGTLESRDVDDRDDWRHAPGERIPVVEFDGRALCQFRLDRSAILAALDASGNPDGAAVTQPRP